MANSKVSESAIQRSILDYLAARHIFAIRVNAGMHFSESKGKKYVTQLAAPGTADILAFPRIRQRDITAYGKSPGANLWYEVPTIIWLEVKTEKGKQSDLQKSFQAQVEAEGHRYAIVRSIEDVEAAMR